MGLKKKEASAVSTQQGFSGFINIKKLLFLIFLRQLLTLITNAQIILQMYLFWGSMFKCIPLQVEIILGTHGCLSSTPT